MLYILYIYIMTYYNENSKIAIYKWRSNHKDEHNAYLFKKNNEYKLLYRDHINSLRRRMYQFHKEAKIFRNILLN